MADSRLGFGIEEQNPRGFCGEWLGSGDVIESISPIDGKPLATVRQVTPADLERIILRAQEAFPTASTIKIAVLYELFRQAEEGRIDLQEVTRPPVPRVGGGGILQDGRRHQK